MGSKIEKVVTEESEEQYGTTAGQADAANASGKLRKTDVAAVGADSDKMGD